MQEIDFRNSNYETHQCSGEVDGDWFIFKCPICKYVRKWNPKKNKMIAQEGEKDVMHKGKYFPVGIDPERLGDDLHN